MVVGLALGSAIVDFEVTEALRETVAERQARPIELLRKIDAVIAELPPVDDFVVIVSQGIAPESLWTIFLGDDVYWPPLRLEGLEPKRVVEMAVRVDGRMDRLAAPLPNRPVDIAG